MRAEQYDVAVIGSGVGGLCSAALLAHRGYRVLVVESLRRLGGRFSTTVYQGFKITTGALVIPTRGVIDEIFRKVGADFKVNEVTTNSIWFDGEWHQLPEKGQINFLLTLAGATDDEKQRIRAAIRQGVEGTPPVDERLSYRDWLSQYTTKQKVLRVFHALTSNTSTVNDFEYPVAHLFRYISPQGQGGMPFFGSAPQGNIVLAEALAGVITRRGGTVWTGARAKRILVQHGAATGIVVSREGDDIEVTSRAVISDTGPKMTVGLTGRSNFTADYLARVDRLRATPIVVSIIASDRPLFPSPSFVITAGTRRIAGGLPVSNVCPQLAPPGQHLTILWGTPPSCSQRMNAKQEIIENQADIEQIFPAFKQHGRILKMEVHDINSRFPAYRSWMGEDIEPETPVTRLYNTGDGVKPFGWEGLAACAQGARQVADAITRQLAPA